MFKYRFNEKKRKMEHKQIYYKAVSNSKINIKSEKYLTFAGSFVPCRFQFTYRVNLIWYISHWLTYMTTSIPPQFRCWTKAYTELLRPKGLRGVLKSNYASANTPLLSMNKRHQYFHLTKFHNPTYRTEWNYNLLDTKYDMDMLNSSLWRMNVSILLSGHCNVDVFGVRLAFSHTSVEPLFITGTPPK